MNDLAPTVPEAEWVLRAMHSVATSNGRRIALPIERELLLAVQRAVLHGEVDVDRLRVVSPSELRRALPDHDRRAFVVRCAILVPYVSLEVDAAKVTALDALAMQLGTAPGLLHELHVERAAQVSRIARDRARRGDRLFVTVHATQPLRGIVDALARHRGDLPLAARYRSLADLPPGSLGRALFDLHRRHGLPLPGEPGGLDESLVRRDLLRVLGGFAFDDAGEQQLIGFLAGVERQAMGRPLLLDAIAEVATRAHLAGALARGLRPRLDRARFDAAFDQGVAASAQLGRDWPWWSDVRTDVAELRLRYGVRVARTVEPARLPAAAAASRAA